MDSHLFLLRQGIWLGQGTISIKGVQEKLNYFTRWKVSENDRGVIFCSQEVEIHGSAEKKINHYSFSIPASDRFTLELEGEAFGKVRGKGVINDKVIAWEVLGEDDICNGFEIFERENSERYKTFAEFGRDDHTGTLIKGSIWLQ